MKFQKQYLLIRLLRNINHYIKGIHPTECCHCYNMINKTVLLIENNMSKNAIMNII